MRIAAINTSNKALLSDSLAALALRKARRYAKNNISTLMSYLIRW